MRSVRAGSTIKMVRQLATALLLVAAMLGSGRSAELFVATNGNDQWSGTLSTPNEAVSDRPLATLERARDVAPSLPRIEPITIWVRSGTYALQRPFVLAPEDSGTAQQGVVYAAMAGETPVISGGQRIVGWQRLGFSSTAATDAVFYLDNLLLTPTQPRMLWADTVSGQPFSKDPAVVKFQGKYWLYYSIPPYAAKGNRGWTIGVAQSHNLVDWRKVAELSNTGPAEQNGFTAPGAIVLGDRVHLFYQTYGNQQQDAICHAWSDDAVHFQRNPTNPIFRPTGDWNCGRAIDADVVPHEDKLLLYWATRDPEMKVQMQGVAAAPLDCDFARGKWTQLNLEGPILKPKTPTPLDAPDLDLTWEGKCIEAAAMARHDGRLYMFYAGNYNNAPQQIGVAVSEDGIHFKRLSDKPLVPCGPPGSWNHRESGHPFLFQDDDGQDYLFYQGNDREGTWYLSVVAIDWKDAVPVVNAEKLWQR